ncbi:MAG: GNAT family N-acetyltransferase [Alphaproteobacteria bacterium]|nr:GNAT family N-acetyltransferase [Alphaproteobacteria bacterium]
MAVTIGIESPLEKEIENLIGELNATLHALTPPEHCYHLTVQQLAGLNTTFFVARDNGVAVACGALVRHHAGVGEIKRMYTRPEYQGRGIGGRVVGEIEKLARSESLRELVLETGDRHPAAWRVYERAGFGRCGPVLDYRASSWSVFYAKPLLADAA